MITNYEEILQYLAVIVPSVFGTVTPLVIKALVNHANEVTYKRNVDELTKIANELKGLISQENVRFKDIQDRLKRMEARR